MFIVLYCYNDIEFILTQLIYIYIYVIWIIKILYWIMLIYIKVYQSAFIRTSLFYLEMYINN